MISVRLQGKPFNITVIQVYAPPSNAEEAEVERFYEDLQDLLELTHQFKLIKKAVESNQLDGKRKCRVLVDTPERKSYCVWGLARGPSLVEARCEQAAGVCDWPL